ncbi:hypothetical protein [Cupriavidus metallidurans]|uniref:hypothetical protein n=1 Tax=Cupriavidus metallidurans TaxID=119219 RepID=UPI000AF6BA50|nr:hypothetical protein [Cupriavidus metallidurans]
MFADYRCRTAQTSSSSICCLTRQLVEFVSWLKSKGLGLRDLSSGADEEALVLYSSPNGWRKFRLEHVSAYGHVAGISQQLPTLPRIRRR